MTDDVFRILLVEDNAADVYLFRKALQGAELQCELTVIADGGKALAHVRGEDEHAGKPVPHLAVIDLNLPKNDGIQVLEAIRAVERFAEMPVVVISSSLSRTARLDEERLRVARRIAKPPNLDEYLRIGEAIREILLRNQSRGAGQ